MGVLRQSRGSKKLWMGRLDKPNSSTKNNGIPKTAEIGKNNGDPKRSQNA